MTWKPGQSGNPKGRAPGSKCRKTVLREALERDGSELAELIKTKAREGDSACMAMWLARLEPPLRQRAEKVRFEFDPSKPLHEQAQQLMVAVAEGQVDPETGVMLMNTISTFAGIRQVDDLLARIETLEQHRR